MVQITNTDIKDVLILDPDVYGDERGFFMETFREEWLEEQGINPRFVQDNLSFSRRRTLRGLHYQIEQPQAKLVMVTKGKVLDVAVDVRQDSPTFGQAVSTLLSGENKRQMFIPVGFAHGFAVLSEQAYFQYKCSDYYNPDGERGIYWNDPELDIDWRIDDPIISEKDQKLPLLGDVSDEDLF